MVKIKTHNKNRIGEEYTTNKGYKIKIVDGSEKRLYCTIEFLIDGTRREAQYAAVKAGYVKYKDYVKLYEKDKVGEQHVTNEGYKVKIVAPGTKRNYVVIEFEKPQLYRAEVQYSTVKLGTIRNVYKKTAFGIGFIGEGKYSTKIKAYTVWRNIMMRCYDETNKNYKAYGGSGIIVCKEWHNYQNFAEWYEKNKIEDWEVDKDLLSEETKTYSPENCCFLPIEMNRKIKDNKIKNKTGCIGVAKEKNKWRADVTNIYLGAYNTKEEAELAYLEGKRLIIWELSKKYSEKIGMKSISLFKKIFKLNGTLKEKRKKIANSKEIKIKISKKINN